MIIKSFVKKPDEKYIELILELSGKECTVNKAYVTGDFFAKNSRALEEVLNGVIGVNASRIDWVKTLISAWELAGVYGVSRNSIIELALKAAGKVKEFCGEVG